jgi:hypothetical protein
MKVLLSGQHFSDLTLVTLNFNPWSFITFPGQPVNYWKMGLSFVHPLSAKSIWTS